MEEDHTARFQKLKFECPNCHFNIFIDVRGDKQAVRKMVENRVIPISRFNEINKKKNFYADKLAEIKGLGRIELINTLKPEFEKYKKQIELRKLAKGQQEKDDDVYLQQEDESLTDL